MSEKTIAEKTAEKCIEKVAQNVLDQINWKGPYSTANRKDMIDIIQSAIDKAVTPLEALLNHKGWYKCKEHPHIWVKKNNNCPVCEDANNDNL